MKNMKPYYNSDRYGYALGVFILSMIYDSDAEWMVFDHDVRSIHGTMMAKHSKENRLQNKIYQSGVLIGTAAFNETVDKSEGIEVTINATIRLIQMKHGELLKRVYKINPENFLSLKHRGVQELTFSSVKIANQFLDILDERYEEYMAAMEIQKQNKKMRKAS